jgi:hypothetical protein
MNEKVHSIIVKFDFLPYEWEKKFNHMWIEFQDEIGDVNNKKTCTRWRDYRRALRVIMLMLNRPDKTCDYMGKLNRPDKTCDYMGKFRETGWTIQQLLACVQNDIDCPDPNNAYCREILEDFESEVLTH